MRERVDYYAELDENYDPEPGRPRSSRALTPRRKANTVRTELAEELFQPEAEFNFTYKAGRHEQLWLSESLAAFYADSLISDVLNVVRGGKEANVYCCQGHENVGYDLLAAKVYRPRLLRNLKNDALYKEGRPLLGDDGKALFDQRSKRAVRKKTRIGSELIINSWIEYEYQTLKTLHQAGADVPGPVAQSGNAILMEYIGDVGVAAPTLSMVRLDRSEARQLFERLLHNVELMLSHHRIHADLSAYNILYWEGQICMIDFPQVVDPLENPHGRALLARDVERLCQYFNTYGLGLNARALADELWGQYVDNRS